MIIKWILLCIAIILLAINLLRADFSVYRQLSSADFLPVIAIALVSFLTKTGVLTALLMGIRRLWKWIRRKQKLELQFRFFAV